MFSRYGTALVMSLILTFIGYHMVPLAEPGIPMPASRTTVFNGTTTYYETPWFIYHIMLAGGLYLLLATIKEMSKEYQAKILEGSIEPSASLNFFSMVDEYYLGYCPSVHKSLYPTAFQEQHAARRTRWTLCFWLAVAAFYCSPYPQSLL